MADPISSFASVVTVAGTAAESIKILYKFFRKFHNASDQVDQWLTTLQSLSSTLSNLQQSSRTLDLRFPFSSRFQQRLLNCVTQLEICTKEVAKIDAELGKASSSEKKKWAHKAKRSWGKAKWAIFGDQKIKNAMRMISLYHYEFGMEFFNMWINSQQALVTPLTISRLDTMRHQEPPRKLEGQEGLIHRKLIRRASDSNIKHLDAAETMPVATPRPRFSPAAIGYSYLNTEPASNITVLRSRKFVKPTVSFHGNSMASKFIIRAGPLVKLRFDRFRKDQSEKCQQIGFGLILSIYLPLFFRESLSLAFFTFQVLVMTQTKNTLRCSLSFPNAVSANAEIFESARAGLTENVKYLLSLGKASAKDITIFGTTLLHSASNSGSMELVRLLIQEGADVNAQDEDGESPLHVAMARSENYNVARTLIENGADLSSKAVDGRTPFHTIFNSTISQVYMRDEWLERMIPDSEGMSITHFLAWSSKSTSEIFQRGRKFDDAGLLSADVMGRTCLHLAASRGNLKVLSYLLSQVLLAALEKKDNQGRTPFHYATESSRAAAVIDLLRDKGCNIYALDNTGRTALHWAARWNNFDAAKKLVALTSRGALLTSDISGRMPSREVCQRKAPDLYKYLRGLEEDSRGVAIQQ